MTKLKTSITSKGQTTVPKAIRAILGVGANDVVYWDVVEGKVQVSSGEPEFFRWIGSIHVAVVAAVALQTKASVATFDARLKRRLGRLGIATW